MILIRTDAFLTRVTFTIGCVAIQMYWLGPLLGGLVAGLLYDLVFAANASVAKVKAFFTQKDYDDSQFGDSSAKVNPQAATA